MEPVRALIAILGLDQHETGALAVARILRDAGVEVIYLGRFNLPERIATTAVDEDVDVVGVSCHSWEYIYHIDELLRRLAEEPTHVPVVVGGSVITESDRQALIRKGVAAVFGPGAQAAEIVGTVRHLADLRRATRTI